MVRTSGPTPLDGMEVPPEVLRGGGTFDRVIPRPAAPSVAMTPTPGDAMPNSLSLSAAS